MKAAVLTGLGEVVIVEDWPEPVPEPGPSVMASTAWTPTPVSAQRPAVSASMGDPAGIGQWASAGVTGATRRPTLPKPAAAPR